MSRVADLLIEAGRNAAAARERNGQLWGSTVANIGQVPNQFVMQQRQQADQDQNRQRIAEQMDLARRADTRASSDQTLQENAAKLASEKEQILGEGIKAGFSSDPKVFDLPKATARITELGHPELAPTLAAVHEKFQPKLTQGTPGSVMRNEQGVVIPGSEIPDKKPDYTVNGQRFSGTTNEPLGPAIPPQTPPKGLQSENEWLVDGKSTPVIFDPSTGARYLTAEDVKSGKPIDPARMKKIPPASAQTQGSVDNVKDAVAGMRAGTIPPILPGRASKEYLALLAEAHRTGYDLASAATDWTATQKHIATMNGAQQLRLNQAINALPDMLDSVDALASKWKGGRFPILNRANLAAAKNGVYGPDVASVANQLDAQIADVTADLGNVYMGGNSPTDHALGLAGKSLQGDWSEKVLHDMVALAKKNVTIRSNSIKNTGVAGASADNPYGAKTETVKPEVWERDAKGVLHKVGG